MRVKPNRAARTEIINFLAERDGYFCYICGIGFTKDDPETIEHFIPLARGGTWELKNLKLAHQLCNSKKGDTMPNEDGTVNFVKRKIRTPKLPKPEQCEHCMSGRLLLIGEKCNVCNSGPQPMQFPTAYKKKPKNCSHSGRDHCWMCVVGFTERING